MSTLIYFMLLPFYLNHPQHSVHLMPDLPRIYALKTSETMHYPSLHNLSPLIQRCDAGNTWEGDFIYYVAIIKGKGKGAGL